MGYEDRPLADPQALRALVETWKAGDELPGRTLASLKTGRLEDVIAALEGDERLAPELAEAWQSWERGRADPTAVLETMVAAGLVDLLDSLAAA